MEKKAALQMYSSELEKSKVLFAEQESARWETTFPALISHQDSGWWNLIKILLEIWTKLQDTLYRKTLTELSRVAVSLRDITVGLGQETVKNANNFVRDCDEAQVISSLGFLIANH